MDRQESSGYYNWAFHYGFSDESVGAYLKETRVIGGHIFWPKPVIRSRGKQLISPGEEKMVFMIELI